MTAPAGAIVSLYVDTRVMTLQPGDIVRTQTGRCYEVVTSRTQQRGKWAGIRQHLTAMVMPKHFEPVDGQRVLLIRWYRR
jgi:hypothetical protein